MAAICGKDRDITFEELALGDTELASPNNLVRGFSVTHAVPMSQVETELQRQVESDQTLSALETRLQAFYAKHNPAKLQNSAAFAKTVNKYRGNEAALNQALLATYGAVLDGAAPQPTIPTPALKR